MRMRYLILTIIALGLLVGTRFTLAQVVGIQPVPPRVMSGSDLGFRVEGLRGDRVIGRVVVRVDGQWVETELVTLPLQLSTR